ncbi:hypothetical protein SUGI_0738330 [Cryptomeria japonica]|nr:hypothetical protein SUGI_0738330 [Cryptomeria japonica]
MASAVVDLVVKRIGGIWIEEINNHIILKGCGRLALAVKTAASLANKKLSKGVGIQIGAAKSGIFYPKSNYTDSQAEL